MCMVQIALLWLTAVGDWRRSLLFRFCLSYITGETLQNDTEIIEALCVCNSVFRCYTNHMCHHSTCVVVLSRFIFFDLLNKSQ